VGLLSKYYLLLLLVGLYPFVSSAQKDLIDMGMLYTWPVHGRNLLSGDGNYVAYTLLNQPIEGQTMVMQSTRSSWKKEVVALHQMLFWSADSKKFYWARNDSIFVQLPGTDCVDLVNTFARWSYPREKSVEWMGGLLKNGSFELHNLISGEVVHLDSIDDYFFDPGGQVLLLYQNYALYWMDLAHQSMHIVWQGAVEQKPGNYRFNPTASQLAFLAGNTIWYYERDMDKAIAVVSDQDTILHGGTISYLDAFSEDSNWLFVGIKQLPFIKQPDLSIPKVAIWSYQDSVLYPAQDADEPIYYTIAVGVHDKTIRPISSNTVEWIAGRVTRNQVVTIHSKLLRGKIDGHNWWPYTETPSYWVLDLSTGQQKLLRPGKQQPASHFHFSPTERWVVYWDEALADFITYDLQTGVSCNLTEGLPVSFVNEAIEREHAEPVGFIGWMASDDLLVYDNYDLWRLDPTGKRAPINLTSGYGHKHRIKLRLVYEKQPDYAKYQEHESLLLSGLNMNNMYNSFFRLPLDKPGEPQLLTMGPYTYYQVRSQQGHPFNFSTGMKPLQSGTSDHPCWVVMRQSATEYPNLYFTEDFKSFRPLTNFQPQKDYNWLTAELIHWKMLNGQISQGVLYKPENFDPNKKYPVIFNYYEKVSHRVHQFPQPGLTMDNINIPWFVSRGYLVFTPDIHYTMASRKGGMTVGEAACNAVVSAAKHLAKLPYVDSKHIGLQGHSFGAMQTAYIVTHSKLFAAAAEMAGTTDHLNSYLSLVGGQDGQAIESEAKQDHPQARMGATPWERPDLYRRNSAVLNADKTTTPLLITHNRKDGSVDFRQGIALYLALRRLGKPCWLLQYANSGHSLNPDDGLDYTMRLTQFFDHYLKGGPKPDWLK
jgi:dipeptidyl aminopeptidase/acylaminoacyl peptidase